MEKEILGNTSLVDLPNEEWRDVEGYEGFYQVSNLGRARSLDRYINNGKFERLIKGRLMKFFYDKDGYAKVSLCKNNSNKNPFVHRLVSKAFIPNPNNYPCINHKNEVKSDNRVENLEWCTHQYNTTYGGGIRRRIENTDFKKRTQNTDYAKRSANTNYAKRTANTDWDSLCKKLINNPKKSKPILQFDLQGNFIKEFPSAMQCEREGFCHSNVVKCCKNKFHKLGNNKYKGYIWKYKDDSRV